MTDPITGLLFAIGVGYAILGWRDQRRRLLLLWLVLGLAGSFLSSQPQVAASLPRIDGPACAGAPGCGYARPGRALVASFFQERSIARKPSQFPSLGCGGMVILALAGATLGIERIFRAAGAINEHDPRFNPTENRIAREVISAWQAGKPSIFRPSFRSFPRCVS